LKRVFTSIMLDYHSEYQATSWKADCWAKSNSNS